MKSKTVKVIFSLTGITSIMYKSFVSHLVSNIGSFCCIVFHTVFGWPHVSTFIQPLSLSLSVFLFE